VDKEENQKAEETKMSEISLSDVLQKIGDEFERKECEKMAIKDKEIEMLKNLLNEKEKRIDELLADSDKYAATFIDYSSEMELEKEIVKEELDRVNEQFDILKDEKNHLLAEKEDYLQMNLQFESTKEELEKIKEEFEKIKDENSRLLTMKEDYLQMSNMFGRFNVEWMESKGLSFFYQLCILFQGYLLHARSAMKSTIRTSISKLHSIVDMHLVKAALKDRSKTTSVVQCATKRLRLMI